MIEYWILDKDGNRYTDMSYLDEAEAIESAQQIIGYDKDMLEVVEVEIDEDTDTAKSFDHVCTVRFEKDEAIPECEDFGLYKEELNGDVDSVDREIRNYDRQLRNEWPSDDIEEM